MKRAYALRNDGFTIIEVLIVLAVGGLIIALVLLAVPQLQRNNRNNQRAHDASVISDAVSNYIIQNQTEIPDGGGAGSADVVCDDSNMAVACPFLTGEKLGYYTINEDVTYHYSADYTNTKAMGALTATDSDKIILANAYQCAGNKAIGNSQHERIVILYAAEKFSSSAPHCIDIK